MNIQFQLLSEEQILNCDEKNYNPYEWKRTIKMYSKFGAKYLKLPAGNGFQYERYYALYVAEGINYLNQVSYSACISSRPLCAMKINEDGLAEKLPMYVEKSPAGRSAMRKMSYTNPDIFFQDQF